MKHLGYMLSGEQGVRVGKRVFSWSAADCAPCLGSSRIEFCRYSRNNCRIFGYKVPRFQEDLPMDVKKGFSKIDSIF